MAYTSTNLYLEARCTFVLAERALIGAPDDEDTAYEPIIEAQCLGHRDAEVSDETGETIDCSPFFTDVPELKGEWHYGWNQYFEMREMEKCGSCNSGNPTQTKTLYVAMKTKEGDSKVYGLLNADWSVIPPTK